MQHEFGLFLPHGYVGHGVLKGLEFTDQLAKSAALIHVGNRIFQHAVDHAQAHGGHHDAFAVQGFGRLLPDLALFPE